MRLKTDNADVICYMSKSLDYLEQGNVKNPKNSSKQLILTMRFFIFSGQLKEFENVSFAETAKKNRALILWL